MTPHMVKVFFFTLMAKVIITLAQFRDTPIEDIATRPERERELILSRIRKSFIRQAKRLDAQSDKYYSNALDVYLTSFGRVYDPSKNPTGKNVIEMNGVKYDLTNYHDPRVMSKNQIIQELAQYHSFFNAKTSTIPGIKKLNKEMDARLFGANKRGSPIKTMTEPERKKYWAMYTEFYNNPNVMANAGLYGSNVVQRTIAEIFIERRNDFKDLDFLTVLSEAKNRIDADAIGMEYTHWSNTPVFTTNGVF